MKKFIVLLALSIILSSCGITYYTYYEVDSIELANTISKQDAEWSPKHISPSRVIAAYPDSTGHMVYLIESKTYDSIKQDDTL